MPFITGLISAIGTAVTAVSGFAAGLGIVGKALLSVGLSLGLSALSSALGSNKSAAAKPGEVSATLQIGGDIPRQVAFGQCAVKGQLVFIATAGVSNERLCQVFVLSDGWCASLDGIWVGDKALPLTPTAPDNGAVAKFTVDHFGDTGFGDKRMTLWFYDGRPGQAAPGRPQVFAPDRWGPSDRLAGMTHVVVELINNNDTFDAIPDLLFVISGYRCHDPRKDPAFGGAGSHSLSNPATWESTQNPALMVLAYLRGIQSEGQTLMGLDLADYDVLSDTFMQAANIADEGVPLDAGGYEPRYRASAVITAQDSDHRSALAPLVQALAGYLIERNGSFGLLAGAAQLPVVTLTDADIDWTRGVKWQGSRSRTERTNEVHGQFVDPAAQGQANSYPPITSPVFSAEDGERLAVQLDFGAITSITQAQRAARIRMRETRRQASASITCGFHLLWLEAGDWLRWQSATFGFDKLYRVVSRQLNPDDTPSLSLQEVGNEIYSWSAADEQPYLPPAGAPTGPPLPSTVMNFTVQPDVISSGDGSTRPILRMRWDPIADARVIAVIIEYRPVGRVAATRVRDDSPGDGEFILDQPPTGLDYEFRATIATVPARPVTWTPWISLTALKDARFLVDVPDLMARFRAQFDWQPVLMPDLTTLVWNTVQEASNADLKASASIRRVEEVSVTQDEARATLATQIDAKFDATQATITDLQTVVATNTSAIATMSTQLVATMEGLDATKATVLTQGSAIATATGAIATLSTQISVTAAGLDTLSGTVTTQGFAIIDLEAGKASVGYATEIEAKVNAVSANGQFDMVATVGPGGPSSRIRMRASTTSGGTMTDAGFMIDVIGGVSRISMIASQFVFVDNAGGNAFAPLIYAAGDWVFDSRIIMRSGTSGRRTVLTNQRMEVYDAAGTLRVRIGIW
ncbi:phage tail protein [Bosea lathyri]|uniref:Tip attachment protein J domain-containing protein n=1 Tax=Bosea lathyri TaxID=1036778 RepID=A0A1H6BEY1_9HYPH|nr:phage tail protein [Bosea lathyri]SEG59230.1 hypothetical protein SAMN04488115_107184 [Bosea lathyri]